MIKKRAKIPALTRSNMSHVGRCLLSVIVASRFGSRRTKMFETKQTPRYRNVMVMKTQDEPAVLAKNVWR